MERQTRLAATALRTASRAKASPSSEVSADSRKTTKTAGLLLILTMKFLQKSLRRLIAEIKRVLDGAAQLSSSPMGVAASTITKLFWKVFPLLYFAHELLIVAYKVLYLLDPTAWPYWSPYLRLQHLALRSVTAAAVVRLCLICRPHTPITLPPVSAGFKQSIFSTLTPSSLFVCVYPVGLQIRRPQMELKSTSRCFPCFQKVSVHLRDKNLAGLRMGGAPAWLLQSRIYSVLLY